MNTVERKIVYTAKQYTRTGFGHTYCFVDTYENARLMHSIMVDRVLSNNELERFLTVFISRANKGTDVSFVDSTEKQMSALFENNKYKMASLEKTETPDGVVFDITYSDGSSEFFTIEKAQDGKDYILIQNTI